jgi:tetratricopeptide (TPR) repeat protein
MTPHLPRWRTCALALVLVAATIFAYQPAWHGGFIWDDDVYILKNPLLTAADGLRRIWFSLDSPSQYFPLVYTTFRFERSLWGLDPTGYHLVNIFLHLANALLLWRLLYQLKIPGAWLAGSIFALHPVHVESVAWITERKNVLMGLFFLLSLLAWRRFLDARPSHGWRWYGLSLASYALALSAKTTACTLPAALLLILWLEKKAVTRARILQVLPYALLGLIMGLIAIWWERYHQGTHGDLFALGPLERLLVASRAVWFYLAKLCWPAELTFIYPQWKIDAGDPVAYLGLAGVLAVAFVIFRARSVAGRSIEVAALFFVATLGPMLGFIMLYTFRYTYVADHYQYLASIGPIALVSAALVRGKEVAQRFRFIVAPATMGILVCLGVLTWRQSATYQDMETLWTTTIAKNPHCWMAYNNLGIALAGRGEHDAAIARYEESIALHPTFAQTHYNLANALVEKGRLDEAISACRVAIELRPRDSDTHIALGNALSAKGAWDEAIAAYATAVALRPQNADAHYSLGNALEQTGELEQAVANYETALRISADIVEAHLHLGNIRMREGREAEGVTCYEKALAIQPDSTEALNNLAWAYSSSRDRSLRNGERALILAEKANRAGGGNNSIILHTLAAAYAQTGQFEQAVRTAETALSLANHQGETELARELHREIQLYRERLDYRLY